VVVVIVVAFTTAAALAATPPNETVAGLVNPVPVIVTSVAPVIGPLAWLTTLTVRQFANVNVPMRVLQLNVPLAFRYSFAYQKVQSSTGSTAIEV
jgi:hypothetical protein